MPRKSNIQRGFYPISMTDVRRYFKNCRQWSYGNKDTCKYVAECVIEKLRMEHETLPIRDNLYSDLISIAHDINNGSLMKKIELKISE